MEYLYKITEEILMKGPYKGRSIYGLECISRKNGSVLWRIGNVSASKKRMEYAVLKFNSLGLSPIHVHDVLDDMLGSFSV